MAGESTQQKTSPTLAQIAACDHSEMLRDALNVNPAKMLREALAFDPAKMLREALVFDPTKAMREALVFDPVKAMREALVFDPTRAMREALEVDPAKMLREALVFDPVKAMREALVFDPVKAMREALEVDPAKAMREALVFDPIRAMQQALPADPYESIHNAISNFEVYEQPVDRTAGFVEDLNVDVQGLFEYIDAHLDAAEMGTDKLRFELEADEHPAVLAIWEYVARYDSWARAKFHKHSEATIKVIEGLAAACIYTFLVSLISVLSVMFGLPGFFVGVVLSGTAKYIDDSRKASLKPQIREGLGATCSTCGAFPDMWCVVTPRGKNPGSPAQTLHKPRLKRQ